MIQRTADYQRRFREARRRSDVLPRSLQQVGLPDPVRISIALLSDGEISQMEIADLVCVIEYADIPPIDKCVFRALDFRHIDDLRRLAYATRTACRDYCTRMFGIHRQLPART